MSKKIDKPGAPTRRRHTNSKLGCLNCKRKKIRCDENLPQCGNCSRGKKETCSYLSLSNSELNRIKITHSLRNSQNKLLNRNYRLPTSSNNSNNSKSGLNGSNGSESNDSNKPSPISSSPSVTPTLSSLHNLLHNDNNDPPNNEITTKFASNKKPTLLHTALHDIDIDHVDMDDGNVLEFKFELAHLPMKIPSIPYPPIQFNNLSMNDFSHDFKVIDDDEITARSDISDDSSKSPSLKPQPLPKSFLPGAKPGAYAFHKLPYHLYNKPRVRDMPNTKVPPELSYQLVQGRFSVIDHLHDLILTMPAWANKADGELLWDALGTLGQVVVLNQMKLMNRYKSVSPFSDEYVDQFERLCFEKHSATITKLKDVCVDFMKPGQHVSQRHKKTNLTSFACCFVTYTSVLLNFSAESYFKVSKNLFEIFNNYADYLIANKLRPSKVFEYLIDNSQYNMMSINIPSYHPQFVFELSTNLESLSLVYKTTTDQLFSQQACNDYYQKLNFQYLNLMNFIKFDILPIMFETRDEDYVCTYPPSVMFNVMKKWYSIFPTEAMYFTAKIVPMINSPTGIFLRDLTVTLYLYYHSISTVLDSLFPSCKYLFGVSCMTPSNKFYDDASMLQVSRLPQYEDWFIPTVVSGGMKCCDFLQRHNFYSCRMGTFFRNRYKLYQNHAIWKNPYGSERLAANRFKARHMKNVLEIPVRSFNNTLIKPEHFPIRIHSHYDILLRDPTVHSIYTRVDENMEQNMYTRNVESVEIFNRQAKLEFDFDGRLLVRDYRPLEINHVPAEAKLGIEELRRYYEDRTLIVSAGVTIYGYMY